MEKQPSPGDQFLTIINKIIEDNIENERFSVEDLARDAGLSRWTLRRKLKKLTGKSSIELITEIRLTRARELLENDMATASEIAYKVGFSDPNYFYRVFKKHFNVSPGDVRKKGAVDLEHLMKEQKQEIPGLAKSKSHKLFIKVAIIIIIIIAGGGVYYLFRANKSFERSVAVLPLHNLTGQPENTYFVDGMHDALIGELGQIESLRVISRASTLRYRDSDMLLPDIARELGVNTIIEGSVIGAGDSLKVLIQMIDLFPKERHILVNEYHDDMHNVLKIQTKAVKDIAQKIRIKLSKDEEQLLTESRTVNPETYKAYLRGMYYLNQGTTESFKTGITFLHEAIERDPADPFAYAGLALGYAIMGHGMVAPRETFHNATAAANRALRIDPTLDEAHTALALIYLYQYWDLPKAQKAFENAIKNNPNNEIAHAHYAYYQVLVGNYEKSIYHSQKSVKINPFSASYNSWLAWLYYYYEEYDKAELWARKSLELKDNIPYGNLILGWTYIKNEQYKEAIETHDKLPDNEPHWKLFRCHSYALVGNKEKALSTWNELEEYSKKNWVNPFHKGMMAGILGFTDMAFELLNEACDKKYYPTLYIDIFPGAEFIRDDPRYNTLLQKLNLPYKKTLLTAQ
ncbi:MAG: helix-turn-helix domain-containing protein [Bacteroidales bacterium]|nr:MAG: helix-turn-helix domain-containing protein [Bacteroidales bacterium]